MVIKNLVSISGPGQGAAIARDGGVITIPLPGGRCMIISGADVVPGAVIELPGGGTVTVPASVTGPDALTESYRGDSKRDKSPGRHEAADRALFPELERLMKSGKSRSAAALELAEKRDESGNFIVQGYGAPDSRARRLRDLYKKERSKSR